jgi:hypothetical protein
LEQAVLEQQERLRATASTTENESALQIVYQEFEAFLQNPSEPLNANRVKSMPKHELEEAIRSISRSIINGMPDVDPRWAEENVNASGMMSPTTND